MAKSPHSLTLALSLAVLSAGSTALPERARAASDEQVDLLELSLEELAEVEIITVTARKREESAQETPIALTAFSNQGLEERGVRTLEGLSQFVPNLEFEDGMLRGASIYIRGVGQRDTRQFLEPGVGVYVDGVYVARQSAMLPVVDVERIEVLRGPQGTLYGRNTIGGAINYVTKKPGPDFEAGADVSLGTFGLLDSRGALNLPLVDERLYTRVNFAARTREGYTENLANGARWDDDNLLSIAPALRYTPSDQLTLDLGGHYSRQNMHQRGGKCFVTDPANSAVAGLLAANALFGSDNPDLHATCARDQAADFDEFSASTSGVYELETYGVSGTINLDPGAFWLFHDNNFKSLSAWQVQSEWDQENDLDSTEEVVIDRVFYTPHDITTISEELTWTSTTTLGDMLPFMPDSIGAGAVLPTLGAFFSWEESEGGEQDNLGLGGGDPLIVPVPDGGGGFLPFDITMSATPARFDQPQIDNESRAVYTQWTVEPSQYLHLTGGVRYTWEKKALERFEPGAIGRESDSFSKVTPMANVTLVAPESWLAPVDGESAILYYTYSEGFKSGGFNEVTDVSTGEIISPFDEETLISHEVGAKLNLFGGKALLNTALFYNDYRDMQLTVIRVTGDGSGLGASITNAGKATIRGVEVELLTNPTRQLQLSSAVGYVDAEYDEFLDTIPGLPGSVQDRSDEPFFNVPDWSVNAGIQYTLDLDGLLGEVPLGNLTPRWDWSYRSERAFHLTRAGYESGLFEQDPVHLHDFRLSWESGGLRYKTSFWIRNVFDEEYTSGAVDLTDFFGTGATRVGAPRTFGVDVAFHYF